MPDHSPIRVETQQDATSVMCALAAKEITPEEAEALLPEVTQHLPVAIAAGRRFAAINRLTQFVADRRSKEMANLHELARTTQPNNEVCGQAGQNRAD